VEEKLMNEIKTPKMSLVHIDGGLAYSDTHVWAYYYIPSTPYEFMGIEERESLAQRINQALAGLVTSAVRSVDAFLYVTSSPLNSADWAASLTETAKNWHPTDGFEEYMDSAQDYLDVSNYRTKEVYLSVLLGKRGGVDESSGFSAILQGVTKTFSKTVDTVLGEEDYQVSGKEMQFWRDKSKDVNRILMSGHLDAEPATDDAVALLFKRTLFPDMPTPVIDRNGAQRWGKGDLLSLGESHIEKNRKFLKITQTGPDGKDMVGYRATLCFARFPDSMMFPQSEPWIHFAALLGLQCDVYSRFTLEPAPKVRKAVSRKIQEIKDEANNAGGTGSIPIGIQERYDTAMQLEHDLSRDTEPWAYGYHRIVVTAGSEDELRDRVQRVINHYQDLQIKVQWTTGDQWLLLQESQPADHVRLKAYQQRQNLAIISGGMPTANSSVGDRIENGKGWIGPYLGHSTSRVREAVFFSPHAVIARNGSPGVLITGSPGGGKSFLAFTLTCQMALQGVWCIYLDPKADAKPISQLAGIGHVNVFDLREGNDGILEPFGLSSDRSEQMLLAIETITLLEGSLNDEKNSALSISVERVANGKNPSLNRVVDDLLQSQEPAAISLGRSLNIKRQLPFARLCFAERNNESVQLRPDEGLSIVTLLGLDLPDASTPKEEYGVSNRLAVAVMYLLTSFTKNLMVSMDKDHPKAVIIDEAWALTATANGRKTIAEIARMGRSHNTVIVLVSQNAADFKAEGLTNSISTKFAFRAKSKDEIGGVLDSFDLEKNTAGNEDVVRHLENGECLMQDMDNRIARVQIDSWNEDWRDAFDTNPLTRGKREAREIEEQEEGRGLRKKELMFS
jgi:AAA-like domain